MKIVPLINSINPKKSENKKKILKTPFKLNKVKNKVIKPNDKEIEINPRSRSAKLRFDIRNEREFSSIKLTELGFELS